MGRQERPWERPPQPDGVISRSAGCAMGLAFVMVQTATIVIVGGWPGAIVGFILGGIVVVALSRLIVSNQRPRRGPPRDLL
jgi:hypothetical protein